MACSPSTPGGATSQRLSDLDCGHSIRRLSSFQTHRQLDSSRALILDAYRVSEQRKTAAPSRWQDRVLSWAGPAQAPETIGDRMQEIRAATGGPIQDHRPG